MCVRRGPSYPSGEDSPIMNICISACAYVDFVWPHCLRALMPSLRLRYHDLSINVTQPFFVASSSGGAGALWTTECNASASTCKAQRGDRPNPTLPSLPPLQLPSSSYCSVRYAVTDHCWKCWRTLFVLPPSKSDRSLSTVRVNFPRMSRPLK